RVEAVDLDDVFGQEQEHQAGDDGRQLERDRRPAIRHLAFEEENPDHIKSREIGLRTGSRRRSPVHRSPTARVPLLARMRSRWLGREGSNLRMAESKSAALPLGYAPSCP